MPTTAAGSFADRRRGSRQSRGYGADWDRVRLLALRRDSGLCLPCMEHGRTTVGTQVDHKVPKYSGGTDDIDNLQTICKPCHDAKTVIEAMAARGLSAPAPRAHCTAAGLPTDPAHPWNLQAGGVEKSTAQHPRTDLSTTLATARNGQGGLRER